MKGSAMKATCLLRIFVALLMSFSLTVPVLAQTYQYETGLPARCVGPAGEDIIADTLVLRPLGAIALGVGAVMSVVSLPFALMTDSAAVVKQKLLVEPFEYTFKRPLGDTDWGCEVDVTTPYWGGGY
jgi:hypothetical protein